MYIEKLKLQNFRNYDNLNLKLSPKINVFYGDNGEGKTNILESIYISAITKSYRTTKDLENVNFNKEYTYVDIKYINKKDKKINKTIRKTGRQHSFKLGETALNVLKKYRTPPVNNVQLKISLFLIIKLRNFALKQSRR